MPILQQCIRRPQRRKHSHLAGAPSARRGKPLPFVYNHAIAAAHRPVRVTPVINWMIISALVEPFGAQQICPPPQPRPAPRLDAVDRRIVEAVRDVGPVKTWSLLNWLAEAEGARSRTEGRAARRILWERVRRLKRLGLVFGRGRNEVATTPPPARPRARRRKRSVNKRAVNRGVSAVAPAAHSQQLQPRHPVDTEVFRRTEPIASASTDSGKSENVTTPAQASEAGRAMAKLRHVPKRPWSGYVGEKRIRRDQKVILADGAEVYAFGTRRGHLVWSLHPGRLVGGLAGEPWQWGVVRAASVRLARCEPASILGALKRGCQEVPSALKQAAARLNGLTPCRAGRKRGRPRRSPLLPR
jgi:hypothetical protein